jgi:hypothetical protein
LWSTFSAGRRHFLAILSASSARRTSQCRIKKIVQAIRLSWWFFYCFLITFYTLFLNENRQLLVNES